MKLSKIVKSSLIIGAIGAQSVLAGQPYVFGTLNNSINIPEGLNAMIVPSIKSGTNDIQVIDKEVWLVPTSEFIFSATGAPNPIPLELPAEDLCANIQEFIEYQGEDRKELRQLKRKHRRERDPVEKAALKQEMKELEESMAEDRADLKRWSLMPALEINGTWDDGFTKAADRLRAANPGLVVQKAPTIIKQISPSGAVNSERPVFTNLEINGQVFNGLGQLENNVIKPETKKLEDSVVDSTEAGEKGVSLFKANEVSGKVINDPGMNGMFSATVALSTACKYFEAEDNNNPLGSLSFQIVRTFPSVRFIKAEARYTASKVYSYFKEVSEGPSKGWNVFKREVNQKIRENTGENEDFEFKFECEDYYPNGNCESKRKEIEEKLRNFLITQAANVFANFAIDANKPETLPMPENKLGEVAGMAGTMYWGPEAGALIKGAAELLSSSSTSVDVKRSFNKEVNEKWSSKDFTSILSSQAGKVNFELN